MKQLAILSYDIMFDPSEAWTNGSQFEANLSDFFAAHGFEAQIIEARGGTGRRVVFLSPIAPVGIPKETKQTQTKQPIQAVQKVNPNAFKEYQNRGIPKTIVNQEKRPPRVEFNPGGRILRQKVRVP